MDLKARLARLEGLGPPRKVAVERLVEPARAPTPLPAEPRDTAFGQAHVATTCFGPEERVGRVELFSALRASADTIAKLALDADLAGVDPEKMLLFDTETTGLSGGAGTLPFVVGLAWFEKGRLVVEQLLLRRPGEEVPLLCLLRDRLEEAALWVSYNGKSFDWPLLRTRFVLNRLVAPKPKPHFDLLHCARRVFSRRLESTSLQALERHVLGHFRVDDLPGSEVPAVYFDYLRDGDGARLAPVLEHNGEDLRSLAAVLGALAGAFEGSFDLGPDASDWFCLASVAERAGEPAKAERFSSIALERNPDPELAVEVLELLAGLHRQRGNFGGAAGALEAALARGPVSSEISARLHLSLAKVHEHRLKDCARAREHARGAAAAETPVAHGRRLARLDRRLARGDNGQKVLIE